LFGRKSPSPDGNGYPFYAELVSVSPRKNCNHVKILKRVQDKKIGENSGK